MACRTFVIASVNGKRVQRTCWHLGTCNKNLAAVLLSLFLPIFPPAWPLFSQPIYLTRPGSVTRQLLHWMHPSLLCLTRRWLCWLTPLLSWGGHRQMWKFTSIPPPWSGEQTCTSFISLARQGCQLDKYGGHSSSRKPTDADLAFSPLCPSAQRCRPSATGPTGDSTQAVPRDTCRGC